MHWTVFQLLKYHPAAIAWFGDRWFTYDQQLELINLRHREWVVAFTRRTMDTDILYLETMASSRALSIQCSPYIYVCKPTQ